MMKKTTLPASLILAGLAAAVVGLIFSAILIKGPNKKMTEPAVTAIPASFPDVKNDPAYKSFLNPAALDPTQSVTVGGNQNAAPFSVSSE